MLLKVVNLCVEQCHGNIIFTFEVYV